LETTQSINQSIASDANPTMLGAVV